MQSCRDCPSFVKTDDVAGVFRRNMGAPVCARFGHVLGKPGLPDAVEANVAETFASGCSGYKQPRPVTLPDYIAASVTVPDAAALMAGETTADKKPSSCQGCRHFVQAPVVQRELGWTLPLCAAKGRLLFHNRFTTEAQKGGVGGAPCEYGDAGASRDTTDGLMLIPQFESSFKGATPVSAWVAAGGRIVDPSEYETDFPVTDDDRECGIRAWRKVPNPYGVGKDARLPIFEPKHFEDAERDKIPMTGDDEHPEDYVDHQDLVFTFAAETWGLDETPLLIGPAGVGKTELGRYIAWMMSAPFDRISISRSSEIDDLIGKWVFEDGETVWVDGRLVKRWRKPGVLLLDEPNVGPPDVWQAIRPLTDNSKQLVLDQAKGMRVPRDPWCFFMMAVNPEWDPKYVATEPLNWADADRLTKVFVNLPPEHVERQIIQRRCSHDDYEVPSGTLDIIMSVAKDVRQAIENGDLPIDWGMRPQIAVARKSAWYPLEVAYRRAVTDILEPATADMILDIVRSYVA